MGNKESIAADSSGPAQEIELASAVTKRIMPQSRGNIQRMQNVVLIWLANKIDDRNEDCRNTVTQLRRVINDINTYTDCDQCVQFIDTIINNKVCMVISGSLGQFIVPRVHNMSQVDSIFILCDNKEHHEQWAKEWPKIKGVFTETSHICEALKQAAQQCEHNAIPMSFVAANMGDVSNETLDRLDPSFVYSQILKEIVLTIKFEQQDIKKFTDYCHRKFADNEELANVKQLEEHYRDETPINWYTRQIFLCPMLNIALRLMDADIIVRMGFFIADLHRQIEKLHSEQFGDHPASIKFTVYRGQGLSKEDFDQMTKTKGGFISFNNFLSTRKTRDVSLGFTLQAARNPDLVGILFIMNIDPAQSTTPFASIRDVSYFQGEDEVLFSIHTVFRINGIKPIGGNNRLFEVNLTLTSNDDKDLRVLSDRIREERSPDSEGWQRLGSVLLNMGQSEKAQEFYEVLLNQITNESEKAPIYNQLGSVKCDQAEYQEALTFFEKALAIQQQSLSPNHADLAKSYVNISVVYHSMGDSPKALASYEKALAIQEQSLPPDHPDLTKSYIDIGVVYHSIGDNPKALSSYEKALAIQQNSLPPNQPDLAMSYMGIGNVYYSMGDYPKALASYEKALAIQQQSLPPNHPNLAKSYVNLGVMYHSMGDSPKALSSYEKALEIQQQSLPPDHPDLAMSYMGIGNVSYSMGDYPKALSYYEKDLAILQQSLPPNHPDLAKSYNNIGNVYYSMGDYLEALSFHEKSLEIKQKTLPPNHPDLAGSYIGIGNVYESKGDNPKALSFHEKALAIQQQSLPPNHPDLAMSYNNIGMVHKNMGNYSKARSFFERAVDVGQKSLPENHPDLQNWRKNIELMKK